MVAPVLNMYEYQFMDGGTLLNGSVALPFIDIMSIKGLDTPPVEVNDVDYDSQHGGFVYARFTSSRTIVFDGILYANPSTIDTTLQSLRNNFVPREDDQPLYIREAGPSQQYIMCKPIGFNYDEDRLRSYGACKIQIQLKAGDPLRYIDKADLAMTAGTNYSITNNGNADTYPTFEIVGGFSEMAIVNNDTGQTVGFPYASDADDFIVLDFKTKSLYVNDVRLSGLLTSIGWWAFAPGVATSFKLISIGSNAMVNPGNESNYAGTYAVGTNWTGTQGVTTEKHSGTKSLRMVRKNKTTTGGTVAVPTGLTGQAAGTYTAWAWIKGSMPKVTISIRNGGSQVAAVTLAANNAKAWKKVQFTFTLASTSGALDFLFTDAGQAGSVYKKGQTLYIDDMGVASINNASLTATAKTKDGWL